VTQHTQTHTRPPNHSSSLENARLYNRLFSNWDRLCNADGRLRSVTRAFVINDRMRSGIGWAGGLSALARGKMWLMGFVMHDVVSKVLRLRDWTWVGCRNVAVALDHR
jgi:hypothetical protein